MKTPWIPRESWQAGVRVAIAMLLLGALILLGSRNLSHSDAALVGYTFASLFAIFGITYRYSMWLQRPPTAMYWLRGWQAFGSILNSPATILIPIVRTCSAFQDAAAVQSVVE